jgi:uracil-DNA glycosylase
MKVNIASDWQELLQNEFKKPYFEELVKQVKQDYAKHNCFPKGSQIFEAFNLCSLKNIKVVIIGQDPYHGFGQAHGLCFSVNDGIQHPPSLMNIFKEIASDINVPYPTSGNLTRWAEQGVLLLNSTLTVRESEAGSHQKFGWENFTDEVISLVSEHCENVVFLLWGGFAKKKVSRINKMKHRILTSGHPSPLSANRGYWFGNKHFSKTNEYLKKHHKSVVNW